MGVFKIKTQEGFTILEVLIVVVVIGILSVITLNTFSGKIQIDRAKGAALELKTFIDQKTKEYRVNHGEMSVGYASGTNVFKVFETDDCSGDTQSSFEIDSRLNFTNLASQPTFCSTANTWILTNSHYCLPLSNDDSLYPIDTGCLAIGQTGSTLLTGISKEASVNYMRTWVYQGSVRWLD